jgi:hypothetical protein
MYKFFKKNKFENTKDVPYLRSICLESNSVQEYFWKSCQHGNDDKKFSTNELLPIINLLIKHYEVAVAAEYGTAQCRVSSALVTGGVEKIYSVDIQKDVVVDHFIKLCENENVEFNFINQDSATYDLPLVDMLFIDSLHNGEHLKKELAGHRNVKKIIAMHDTETFKNFGDQGENLDKEINNFLLENSENWELAMRFTHNNGMVVLSRK